MDNTNLLKRLQRPTCKIDVVMDTDTYNEIDDQFALSYLLSYGERICTKAVFAAPFFNSHSDGPADGMEKSYEEIHHLLDLLGREDLRPFVFKGSPKYLDDEQTPVVSPASEYLCKLALNYTPDKPLYVVTIGAITNIASALLMEPQIADRIVVIWMGGHALHWPNTNEFNMSQDIAAARIVFGCGVPLVQIPGMGVSSAFTISEAELEKWLRGKNKLCDYLVQHTVDEVTYAVGRPWTRVIWDVVAVAWLTGEFTGSLIIPSPIPEYDNHYSINPERHPICYVYHVDRDALVEDLFERLSGM